MAEYEFEHGEQEDG